MNKPLNAIFFCTLLMLSFTICSCTTNKNIAYFKDFADTTRRTTISLPAFNYPKIQRDDILNITVQTIDPNINALLNNSNTFTGAAIAGSAVGGGTTTPGYLVDQNGEVELPFVGNVKVLGLTTLEAKELIREKLTASVNDPRVNVKFANFKVTIIGEVSRPGSYIMPNEKVSVLDAIGLAGDLTIYGRRENILLLRDTTGNEKNMVHLDINSTGFISSPYYYLQSNDVIYIEPNKDKIESTDIRKTRAVAYFISGTTLLVSIITRIILK